MLNLVVIALSVVVVLGFLCTYYSFRWFLEKIVGLEIRVKELSIGSTCESAQTTELSSKASQANKFEF